MNSYYIGLDFGTDSVRALLTDREGREAGSAVRMYPRWRRGDFCDAPSCRFRQHPLDYLECMEQAIREVLKNIDPAAVSGIGMDTTGSTICAVDRAGTPLALLPAFAEDPDAMFLLWKDHTAREEAECIGEAAKRSGVDYRKYEGGAYSCEWYWSKILHVLRKNPRVRQAAFGWVEHCDWLIGELTGRTDPVTLLRSRCAAGHKAMWHEDWGGLPPDEFFRSVDPLLSGLRDRYSPETVTAGHPAGTLCRKWAERLGLSEQTVVAVGELDCHAGAVGAGIRPGELVKVFGTSTCDIAVAAGMTECVPGICGQVDGSVVPGLTGFEAGQAAFGDVFAWFRIFLSFGGNDISLAALEKEAALLAPDPEGPAALDWFNGRRSPDMNADLHGAVFGLNLGSTPVMVYRALAEAACCGAKRIVDHFLQAGIRIDSITATGGISRKSPFIMQMCADLIRLPIRVAASDQVCALGSAMFAAAASGAYGSLPEAMESMKPGFDLEYRPDPEKSDVYGRIYQRYLTYGNLMETAERAPSAR